METLSSLFPTDNLYKFLALTGLITIGICVFYFDASWYTIDQQMSELEYNQELTNHLYNLDNRKLGIDSIILKRIEAFSNKSMNDIRKTTGIDFYRLSLPMYTDDSMIDLNFPEFNSTSQTTFNKQLYRNKVIMYIKNKKIINSLYEKLIRGHEDQAQKQFKLKKIVKNINLQIKRIRELSIYTTIGICVGILISTFGFKNWYDLLQKPQDEITSLQLKELKDKQHKSRIILP